MRQQHFFTFKQNVTSVNITPFHFRFLMHLANTRFKGDLSLTIHYLLKKYLVYLYKISLTPTKKTLTATYQPRTKEYRIKKIHIQPTYWGKLNNLRFYLGYSASFILRIMLDWEMQEEGIPLIPLILRPSLEQDDFVEHEQIWYGYNYSAYNRLDRGNLEVLNIFSCPAA